jgi:hypothetical protein
MIQNYIRMKTIILLLLTAFFTGSVYAQEQQGVKDEGAHQAEYNSEAQDRDHSGEINSRSQSSEDIEGDNSDPGEQVSAAAVDTVGEADAVPVGTRTTSSAGSPGVLVEDGTDGTNTMQRAKPNIAGSPVPGGTENTTSNTGDRSPNRSFEGEKKQKQVKAAPRQGSDDGPSKDQEKK